MCAGDENSGPCVYTARTPKVPPFVLSLALNGELESVHQSVPPRAITYIPTQGR